MQSIQSLITTLHDSLPTETMSNIRFDSFFAYTSLTYPKPTSSLDSGGSHKTFRLSLHPTALPFTECHWHKRGDAMGFYRLRISGRNPNRRGNLGYRERAFSWTPNLQWDDAISGSASTVATMWVPIRKQQQKANVSVTSEKT